jgi:hypothetical protein
MRLWGTLWLGLLVGLLGGCISEQPLRSTSWLERLRGNSGPTGPDVVQMEVDLIERPINDPYLNHGLWKLADEQNIDLERKAVLQDNGFQIGQISGLIPPPLLALLRSERSCANPRLVLFHAGDPRNVVLGPTLPSCSFRLILNSQEEEVQLDQALCALVVTATLVEDGRIRLSFVPQVKHGQSMNVFRPTPNGQDFMMQQERPTENYTALGWEITTGPNEYVIIGGRMDRPESLGHQCFIREGETRGVQRVLALRASRAERGFTPDAAEGDPGSGSAFEKSPSLALQASMTSARGSSP